MKVEKIGPAEATDAEEEATVVEAAGMVGEAEEATVAEEVEGEAVMDEGVAMEETDRPSAIVAPFQWRRVKKSMSR